MLDKPTYDRILKEVPTFRFISQSILIERLKINGSLARVAIRHLEKEGQIKRIVHHSAQLIYSAYSALQIVYYVSLTIVRLFSARDRCGGVKELCVDVVIFFLLCIHESTAPMYMHNRFMHRKLFCIHVPTPGAANAWQRFGVRLAAVVAAGVRTYLDVRCAMSAFYARFYSEYRVESRPGKIRK